MNKRIAIQLFGLILLTLCWNCTDGEAENQSMDVIIDVNRLDNEKESVTGLILRPITFHEEVLSQGVVFAPEEAIVDFQSQGQISAIHIRTGQRVEKGQLLGQLENQDLQYNIDRLQLQLKKTDLDILSELIRLGYDPNTSPEDIPTLVRQNAELKFGRALLQKELEIGQYEWLKTEIRAPISGIVAEVEAKAHNPSTHYPYFCTIINDERLQIEFPILEVEIPLVQVGQKVSFRPLLEGGTNHWATVTAINPRVDERGTVKVIASINGTRRGDLLAGMTVACSINRDLVNQIVVPKTAVVDRQGRLVCFKLAADSSVHWTQVEVGYENTREYTILKGITAGDTIVMDRSFHLSHLEKVIPLAIQNQ